MRTRGKPQNGVGHSQPKPFSGPSRGKTLKRCKNNGKANNIVIDIDDDDGDDVNIDDVPGKDKSCPIPIIICSDEEDEVFDKNQPSTSVEVGARVASDASTSSRSPPSPNQTGNTTDGDECQILHENESPVKLSKCKRTYCGKASTRNRYGLDLDFDCELSNKNENDIDYMEDPSGVIQASWEKANKRKKGGIIGGESVKDAQPTTSGAQQKVEVEKENKTSKCSKDRVHLNSDKVSSNENTTYHFADADKSAFHKKTPFSSSDLRKSRFTGRVFSVNKASSGVKIGNNIGSNVCQHPVDTDVGNATPSCSSHFPDEIRSRCSNSSDKENIVSEQPLFQKSKSTGETRVSDDLGENDAEAASGKCAGKDPPTGRNNDHLVDIEFEALHRESAGKDPPCGIPDLREREGLRPEKVNPVPKEPSLKNKLTRNGVETEPNGFSQGEHKDKPLQDEAGGDVDTFRDCLINNREKLKETDEYKRAAEEEWASRQQALRQQAEEAQKMRQVLKRKRRLLDMENRQKQRVEEIRETQKKGEENMNMKEKLRDEVRMELKQLELKCLDMGSLLRALGVHVSGGLLPQPHDIRVAYKKALLSFHPDKAPPADIRKLVEAEEKFMLISNMKKKFLATA